MGSNNTVWLPTFFKIPSFVFSRRNKFIRVWNNMRVSNDDIISFLGELSIKDLLAVLVLHF